MSNIKINKIVSCLVLIVTCDCFSQPNESLEHVGNKVVKTEEIMRNMMEAYSLPSLSLAISVDQQLVFSKALGYADIDAKTLANPETQYSVGSIAKSMTSIALAKLIDDGGMQLDIDIHNYLPDYPVLKYPITVRQLASHTAGIGRPWKARNALEFGEAKDRSSPQEVLSIFSSKPLLFEPGTNFQYTSCGYILLSAIIESVSDHNYIETMQQVFSDLEMVHTEHDNSTAGTRAEASYYSNKSEAGIFVPGVKKRDRSYLFGGGGFISTPADLVKLGDAFYRDDYLSKTTTELLLTPVKLENAKMNPQWYGLGWRMMAIPNMKLEGKTLNVVHHGGSTSGAASAFLLLVPEYKAAIAFATNIDPKNGRRLRLELAEVLLDYLR